MVAPRSVLMKELVRFVGGDAICEAAAALRGGFETLRYFNREHVLSGRLYLSIFIR